MMHSVLAPTLSVGLSDLGIALRERHSPDGLCWYRDAPLELQGLKDQYRNAPMELQGLKDQYRDVPLELQGLKDQYRNAPMELQGLKDQSDTSIVRSAAQGYEIDPSSRQGLKDRWICPV